MLEKLLSHRLRGFGLPDHSSSTLNRALRAPVPYLEEDARESRDRKIYLYHDPRTGRDLDARLRIAETV